jgi:uncharacterized membrane protein YjjP (DUF1212 family)
MKLTRIENLVSWMWTGAALIGFALFFFIRGWLLTELGMAPVTYRSGGVLDPQIAIVGSVVLFVIGVTIVTAAIITKWKQR